MGVLTMAGVEGELIRREGGIMLKVGLDAVTQNGTNGDLNDPIRTAVRSIGMPVADAITVTDADLIPVTGWMVEKLLDLAELRLLDTLWGNWGEYSETWLDHGEQRQQLGDRIQAKINDLKDRLRRPYGQDIPPGAMGQIRHGERIPNDPRLTPFPGATFDRWSSW